MRQQRGSRVSRSYVLADTVAQGADVDEYLDRLAAIVARPVNETLDRRPSTSLCSQQSSLAVFGMSRRISIDLSPRGDAINATPQRTLTSQSLNRVTPPRGRGLTGPGAQLTHQPAKSPAC